MLFAVPLMAAVFVSPSQAQTCDPEKLYDIITSSFHQSVAQRTDGSWAGWGEQMGASAGNVLSPQDLNGVNYSALGTAAPLLVTSGSNVTSHQTIMLATDGLYAWGGAGTVINAGIKAGNNFQKFAVNGKADGLPTGVVPDDVDQLFATYRLLTIVTKTGDAWVLGNQSSNVPALLGDNSPATDNQWHRVQRPADPSQPYNATTNPLVPLQNVFALRGQRGTAAGSGAMMALTNTGGVVEAWTWGPATFLGDGSAVASRPHAVRMTLPAAPVPGAVPKMIGVTGQSGANTNSYFVLFDSGHLFSMGSNVQRQLGDFTTITRTSWVAVERPAVGDSNVSAGAFTDVKFISVQEHDIGGGNGGAAAALITDGGVLYTWGSNSGRMIGRKHGPGYAAADALADGCTPNSGAGTPPIRACHPGIPEGFLPGSHFAKLVEVGGHTTVYMRERSAKFCYVGHRISGSMGHGANDSEMDFGPFNCEETPVLNICGSTGYDYGDAPAIYEAGGGGNLASHFYIEQEYPNPPQVGVDPENRLYLGENWPRVNDDTPHSVVISTDNTAPLGDCGDWGPGGCEEDAPTNPAQLTLPDTATSHAFDIRVFNEALDADGDPVPARLYAWVDWNNNGVFEPGEYFANGGANGLAIPQNPVPGTGQTITLNWTGLSGLTPGWRYVRLRLTTATNLADLPATPNLDERALRFAGDGEMEDFRVLIVDEDAPPNEPPVAIDVHADAVTPTAPPARLLVGGLDAALQGWDGDGTVVSYRVQTLPACHVPGSGPLPAYPAGGCRLYKRVGVTLTPLTAGEPITLAQAQDLWFETNQPTGTSFTFRAIDDDGDESVNMACDSLVNDCDNTDLLPRPGVMESRDAIFTIPVTQPVLSIEKTVSVDPGNFEIGVPASYTLTVTNTNAPTYADSVITDVIPTGLTIGTLPAGCVLNPPASQTVVCTIPAPLGYGLVVNDNVASFTIPVTPTAGISSPVTNTATVTGGGDSNCTLDPADPACSSTVVTGVEGADMEPVFSGIPAVLEPGEVFAGTLTCVNNGPGSAVAATCVPSVDVGTISNIVCVPTPPASVAVGDAMVCTFDYTAPGTPGGSDTGPTDVTFTGTTGADNDIDPSNNSTDVEVPIIDAVDDATSVPGGSTGNTFDLTSNDDYPPGSTFTYTGGTCVNGSVSAGGTATFDATPNPCTVTYQVCAPAPNQTQCDTATLTVTSELADMTPAFGGIPAVLEPGEVVAGATLTCTNAGPSSATNATCVPSVDAGAISNLVCLPTPPTNVAMGNAIICTFDYTAPGTPGGSDTGPTDVTFTGTTGAVNDSNGGTGTGGNNSTVLNPPIIDALDDDFTGTPIDGVAGGTTPSVIGNDTLGNGPTVIGGNASLTPGTPSDPALVMNPDGTITVPPLMPPGTYTYPYTICMVPATTPPTCDTATATLVVGETSSLTLVKSVTSTGPYTAGDVIAYSFVVTNTGNTVLSGIAINDPILDAPAVCAATTLAPGASTTCTGSYTVQPGDVDAGNVHNVATAEGTPPATPTNPTPDPVPSDPDDTDTPIQNPSLTLVKSV
ncbi:GEVED domain-containing protein, partial [Xanthomonadaceae bacterium JHOS43]|nr:GEVED domain-containing protein [Xanthomonadaceae bacterium JHOS43]